MSNILLIEPDYKNKYPPLGLMKIAYFHKHIMHDYVLFSKGELPPALSNTKWDHVYVTTLFTFEWASTIAAINYAKTLVDSIGKITVGGIAATLLPDDLFRDTGIHPVTGLLNEPGKLGLPGDECIDQIVPDYSILDDIDYKYPFRDAYFLSATKGCGNRCGFCAVQTLEPTFVPYIDIKEKIAAIDREFGAKKDLLLMDNNVLRSPNFDQIIDDIIAAGFAKGATYTNPKTGKTVRRYVDFNQGLDALFLNEAKAKRLGEIALRPARVAFDHIEDKDIYERALRLCAKYGITELSNYVLYNSEDFGGKGRKYAADTPADLYNRMRITLDLRDEINKGLPAESHVAAFSFPMRYIPLSAHERGYVGSKWNAKYLRAVQCMLIPTQGKGVGSRSFFEADFGKDADEFVKYLSMPDKLIAARGKFSENSRGHKDDTEEERLARKSIWDKNQERIKEWNRLYAKLGNERDSFVNLIGDNEFLPEKFLGISSDIQKKLYLHYLTTPRIISLLGMVSKDSPTYTMLYDYITTEFPHLYEAILQLVCESETQQYYVIKNILYFFGKKGVSDILYRLRTIDFAVDTQLKKWNYECKKSGIEYVDFELIRIYCRFVEIKALSKTDHKLCQDAILEMRMGDLAAIMQGSMDRFQSNLSDSLSKEKGNEYLSQAMKSIVANIQLRLNSFLEE